jgi:hypothetical protein
MANVGTDQEAPAVVSSEEGTTLKSSSEQVPTIWKLYQNKFQIFACYMTAFGNGLNDAAPRALIASIEK